MIRILNLVFGWFGYEWVKEDQTSRPAEKEDDSSITGMDEEEGWDHLYNNTPSYRLKKRSNSVR